MLVLIIKFFRINKELSHKLRIFIAKRISVIPSFTYKNEYSGGICTVL